MINYRMVSGKIQSFCKTCASDIVLCTQCDNADHSMNMHTIDHEGRFCTKCYERLGTCSKHGKTTFPIYSIWHTNKTACDKCFREGVVNKCQGCGQIKSADRIRKVELSRISLSLCLSCKKKVGTYEP